MSFQAFATLVNIVLTCVLGLNTFMLWRHRKERSQLAQRVAEIEGLLRPGSHGKPK